MCFAVKEIARTHLSPAKKKILEEEVVPCFYFESSISIDSHMEGHCHITNTFKMFLFSWI